MRYTMKALEQAATALGATIDRTDGGWMDVTVDAPAGKVWRCNDCHSVTATSYHGRGATAFVVEELITDLSDGLRDCDDPECEDCFPPIWDEAAGEYRDDPQFAAAVAARRAV